MLLPIDPELDCFIGGLELPNVTREEDDAFTKLFEDGALAAKLGGDRAAHIHVERLQAEIAKLNAQVAKTRTAPARSGNAPLDDAQRLQKMYKGIHFGKKAARIAKSANGEWTFEYDEHGELLRGYVNDAA
jgi:hypothetical protein